MTQLVSQVAPPSRDMACSQVASPAESEVKRPRTWVTIPPISYSDRKVPTLPSKRPIPGSPRFVGSLAVRYQSYHRPLLAS